MRPLTTIGTESAEWGAAIEEIVERWRAEASRAGKDRIYAEELAPSVVERFSAMPIAGAPSDLDLDEATHLISVLGFSWQPVVLMAARVRPEQMLLLGTVESVSRPSAGFTPLELLADLAGIPEERVRVVAVEEPVETAIYRAMRDFTEGVTGSRVVIDPTGGKKSMSAAAALAGYLAGVPLVYVDYRSYEGSMPTPGSEYPRYLANPLDVYGDLELRRVRQAFDQGAFVDAGQRAAWLVDRLDVPTEAVLLERMAAAYGAWDAFQVGRARDLLEGLTASAVLARVAGRGEADRVRAHADSLRQLDGGDAPVHAAALFSAAERRRAAGRTPEALSLYWAAVEFVVTDRLRRVFGIDRSSTSRGHIQAVLEKADRPMVSLQLRGGRLSAREALRVLVALEPPDGGEHVLGRLDQLRDSRNQSPFAHGSRSRFDVGLLADLREAAHAALATWVTNFDRLVEDLRFPVLDGKHRVGPGS